MTKAPISLQDLRRRIYAKAKAEPSWRFWGMPGNDGASAGRGGVGGGCTEHWGSSMSTRFVGQSRKRSRPDRSHNPWGEACRKAECGKSACSV